ncbi:MAG: HAD family hydrolase [Clostridiales bacterium]|nr:HAD family hydrolase [Clostridiales bacterium]
MEHQIIMFDFDNTLVKSLKFWHKVLDKETFWFFGKKPNKRMSQIRLGITIKETAEEFIKLAQIDATCNDVYSAWEKLMSKHYLNKIKMIKGAKEFLLKLKTEGKTLVLASATQDSLLKTALQHFNIDIFDYIFTEANTNVSKRNITFFHNILKQLKTKPENIAFFEDSVSSLTNASSLGIKCYAVIGDFNKQHKQQLSLMCENCIKNYKKLTKKSK